MTGLPGVSEVPPVPVSTIALDGRDEFPVQVQIDVAQIGTRSSVDHDFVQDEEARARMPLRRPNMIPVFSFAHQQTPQAAPQRQRGVPCIKINKMSGTIAGERGGSAGLRFTFENVSDLLLKIVKLQGSEESQ